MFGEPCGIEVPVHFRFLAVEPCGYFVVQSSHDMRLPQGGWGSNDSRYLAGYVARVPTARMLPFPRFRGIILNVKQIQLTLATLLVLSGLACACDFQVDPATAKLFYRSEGWALPPVGRGKLSAPVIFQGPGQAVAALKFGPGPVEGLTTRVIIHEGTEADPNLFEIPKQEFEQDGKHHVMSSQMMVMDHWIWRYEVDGKVVAYTIGFTPVKGHRENGKWKSEGELACIFYGTFIDDRGDGVFRLLAPGWMKPDLLPQWASDRKKDPA